MPVLLKVNPPPHVGAFVRKAGLFKSDTSVVNETFSIGIAVRAR